MARFCTNCGKKLSLLSGISGQALCKDCRAAFKSELAGAEQDILRAKNCVQEQLEVLGRQDRRSLLALYSRIYGEFEADKELEEQEIETLQKMQEAFGLTKEEVRFDERIRPYVYLNTVRKEGRLPSVEIPTAAGSHVILRKGEIAHFAASAVLKEVKSVSLGYRGGSHGVSFRIAKGVRYRVGAHRGHIVKEQRLLESSRGLLVVTNTRLLLHPSPGQKPVSIPLNKILSYQCFDDGIAVYKEGREKPYLFGIDKTVELFGLCLGHLLG
jgi:hypothetical protein